MEIFLALILGGIFALVSAFLSSGTVSRSEDIPPALFLGLFIAALSIVALLILLIFINIPWWVITFGPAAIIYATIRILTWAGSK